MKEIFYFTNYPSRITFLFKKNRKYFLSRLIIIVTCLLSVSFSYAQPGEALAFDGLSNYVTLPSTIASGSYTKEAWINTNTLTGFPNILSGTGTALFLNNGKLAAGHAPSFTQLLDTTTTNSIVAGTWYHVAVTYDATANELKLYRDGVLLADTIDISTPSYTESTLSIGTFAGGLYWDGQIDEVRIWNVARTQAEIAGSMNCALTGDEPGLLAYYNFNEGIAGSLNTGLTNLGDSSDKCTHYDGTLQNFALAGSTSNWVAPGAPLTGGCTNTYPNINVTGNSACIINGDSTPSFTDSTDFADYVSLPITKTFVVENTGGADITISSITITGADAADFTVSTSPSTTIAGGTSSNLKITFSPTGVLGLKSAIVTINNNDGDEGTFTFAIQGNYAGPGKALAFSGLANYVTLQNVALSGGSYTKEAWISTGFIGGFPNILSGTGTALFMNNGQLAAGHAPSFGQLLDTTTVNPIVTNTWYHVAVTYEAATGEMKLYRDGVLVADSVGVPAYTEPSLSIGTFLGGNYWIGKIDEVRIWNFARAGASISDSMNCSLTGNEPGLLAYYNFTNGIAGGNNAGITTLPNISTGCISCDGTLSGFDLTGTTSNWVSDTLAPTTCMILPVSLQSFNGHIDGSFVKFTWKTSAELSNKGFEIQRSANGSANWVTIGYISAIPSASGLSIYNFTDNSPLQGINTYRLKQIDINGNNKLSRIIAFNFGVKGSVISLYPNPVKDKVNLVFSDNKLLNTAVRLTTITGRVISITNLLANYQQIDLGHVPDGIYLLTFSNGEVRRVIKQ